MKELFCQSIWDGKAEAARYGFYAAGADAAVSERFTLSLDFLDQIVFNAQRRFVVDAVTSGGLPYTNHLSDQHPPGKPGERSVSKPVFVRAARSLPRPDPDWQLSFFGERGGPAVTRSSAIRDCPTFSNPPGLIQGRAKGRDRTASDHPSVAGCPARRAVPGTGLRHLRIDRVEVSFKPPDHSGWLSATSCCSEGSFTRSKEHHRLWRSTSSNTRVLIRPRLLPLGDEGNSVGTARMTHERAAALVVPDTRIRGGSPNVALPFAGPDDSQSGPPIAKIASCGLFAVAEVRSALMSLPLPAGPPERLHRKEHRSLAANRCWSRLRWGRALPPEFGPASGQ